MSWILLTADVTEELALGQKLLKLRPSPFWICSSAWFSASSHF